MGNKVTLVNKKHSAGDKHWKNVVKIQANTYSVIFCSLLDFSSAKSCDFLLVKPKKSRQSDRLTMRFPLGKIWVMTSRLGLCFIG